MAMHRLAKDLKVMPLFKGVSAEAIREIKFQTVADIIRPLNHPKFLNDFLVNCHVIAQHVTDMQPSEIENMIVEAFPLHFLLPTSRYTFQELDRLLQIKSEQPDNPTINQRLIGIRRALKTIAGRMAREKAPGVFSFLEQLYRNKILAFKELPAEAQYLVNTRNMAEDIMANLNRYKDALENIKSPDEAVVYLKCFRSAAPIMIDENKWETIRDISALINRVSNMDIMSSAAVLNALQPDKNKMEMKSADAGYLDDLDINEKILAYIFMDYSAKFISAYENLDQSSRSLLDRILDNLGALGVHVLSQVLAASNDKQTRKLCIESLIKKGERARKWALNVLEKTDASWYLHRNALMILKRVSKSAEDFEKIRDYLQHANSRIREAMISLVIVMRPKDAESLIVKALDDHDVKVRWRASRAFADIAPITEDCVKGILGIVTRPLPEEKQAASDQMKKMMNAISAMGSLRDIPGKSIVETDMIGVLNEMAGQEKGFLKFFKRAMGSEDEIGVFKSAIPLLGRIGGQASEKFLKKMVKSHAQLAGPVRKALDSIRARIE
jgi:HEAT repeat protein